MGTTIMPKVNSPSTYNSFMRLRTGYMLASGNMDVIRVAMKSKYGDNWVSLMNKGEYSRYEKADKKESKYSDEFFALLDEISPRNWRSGVSCYWVLTQLLFADAITSGQLSEVPVGGHMTTPQQLKAFCMPVAPKGWDSV